MSEIPGAAADAVAKLLTSNIKRPDGQDATAFNDQAKAIKAIRTAVIDHEERLAVLEATPSQPFPF